ncbi:MAG: phytanoyl-CoA dioxygenase family protein [Lewinellaceae bacterium]|nr:phytanoyl-CoA dioxygenase family protein [Saprospiraceae bacterium]MCB9338770.1 phytanoyl-CoA dioxygenase family protein [Lewinellaceae bacterium]
MVSLRDIFKKQTGVLRGLKISYVINNLLNADKLRHNKNLYKKHGLRKSVFSPIGSHDFKKHSTEIPWLDRPGAEHALEEHPDFQKFSAPEQAQLRQFVNKGYMIFEGFYSPASVAKANDEMDRLLREHKTDFNYTGRKVMDAYRFSTALDQDFFKNDRLLNLLNFAMGKKVIPFQTINFREGSEQRAHSDSIHMTTEPPGYLIASWTALEDCHEGNGALFYYPGSHRLPYITCQDYESGNTAWSLGEESNRRYEDRIEKLIAAHDFRKEHFFAKKGDVLIWHANLLHGGSAISQPGATRKSMVAHYFCEGVICYHEITQRPAILKNG